MMDNIMILHIKQIECIIRHLWRQNKKPWFTRWVKRHHDDVIKRNHFPRYWPFVWEIHLSPVNSHHKGQWRGALMFCFFICALNKRLSKQSWSWWFETPSRLFWRLCNDTQLFFGDKYSYVSNVEHKQMWILTQGMRYKINRLEGPNFRT